MNVRNSILNKISSIVPVLVELKKDKKITNDFVEVEFELPPTISADDSAVAKFTVQCPLDGDC